MLATATVLGFLSYVFNIERYHIGQGPIPAWVPFAIDAAIAGAVGAILIVGTRWFDDRPSGLSAEYVVVSKPVWESVQHEIVAARSARAPSKSAPAVPTPTLPPAPVTPPAPAAPVPIVQPWDEGPLTPPPAPARSAASVAPARPALSSTPAAVRPPTPAPPMAAVRTSAPSAPAPTPLPKPTVVPAALRPTEPPRTAPATAPSEDDFEEIRRLGGLLGIVRERGESAAEYAHRVEREVAASPRPIPSPRPPEVSVPLPPVKSAPAPGSTPDIDELMTWLEKMAAEKQAPPAPATPAKKAAPAARESDPAGSNPP
jgi:hypothetical protein